MNFREPFQVNVFVVSVSSGHPVYLMLKRGESNGGFWQGVTGARETNEPMLDAAKRELLEETGIVASKIHELNFSYSFPLERDSWSVSFREDVTQIREEVFWVEVEGQPIPRLSEEHGEHQWVGFETAMGLLKWQNNKDALRVLHRRLIANSK